jgi:hypothetical protein
MERSRSLWSGAKACHSPLLRFFVVTIDNVAVWVIGRRTKRRNNDASCIFPHCHSGLGVTNVATSMRRRRVRMHPFPQGDMCLPASALSATPQTLHRY